MSFNIRSQPTFKSYSVCCGFCLVTLLLVFVLPSIDPSRLFELMLGAAATSGDQDARVLYACLGCKGECTRDQVTPAARNACGEIESWRCRACNSARVRCSRVLERHPSIETMGAEAQDLVQVALKCKHLYGDDLVVALRGHYQVTYTASSSLEMIGTGNWLDEDDLNDKYKNKPARLAAIKKNTETYFCTKGEVLLYEDMIYQSVRVDATSAKREMSSTAEVNKTVKKARAKKELDVDESALLEAKAIAKAKGKGKGKAEDKERKPLTDQQKTKLEKAKTDMNTLADAVADATKELSQEHGWAQHVPAYIKKGLDLAKIAHVSAMGNIELALGNNQVEKMSDLFQEISAVKSKFKEAQRRALVQMEEAKHVDA